jgi:hypothetical protein
MTEKRDTSEAKRERPIDRMREACEKRGVPFTETTQPGRRTLIFYGSAKSGGRGRE